MSKDNNQRKLDHIKLSLETIKKRNKKRSNNILNSSFTRVKLHSNEFSKLKIEDINLSSTFFDETVPFPFYINAMTGGSKKVVKINEFLAKLAYELKIPIILGSQSSALKDESLAYTYNMVKNYKDLIRVSNINPNYDEKDAGEALKMINTNKISVHLNMIQELVMIEGDRDFSKWEDNVTKIINTYSPYVIIKGVGYGFSQQTIDKLVKLKAPIIDLSGDGGTNFINIENRRRKEKAHFFHEFSYTTEEMLLYVRDKYPNQIVHASGGINNALDIVKSLVLGARMVGMSSYFLKLAHGSYSNAISQINQLVIDIKKIMIILGVRNISELKRLSYTLVD